MKHRLTASLVIISLVAALITGCGGGSSQTSGGAPEGQAGKQQEATEGTATEEAAENTEENTTEEAVETTAENPNAETAAEATTQAEQTAEPVFPVVLLENDLCRISLNEMIVNEYVGLELQIENLTEEELTVFLQYPYINGMAASAFMGQDAIFTLDPKEDGTHEWRFNNNSKKLVDPEPILGSLEDLKRLDAVCTFKPTNGDYIDEPLVWDLTGDNYNAAAEFVPGQNDALAVDNDVIQAYNGDLAVDAIDLGATVSSELILVNKTDRWLVTAFNNKMLVNGEEWENRGETTSGQVPLQYIAPHSVDYTLLKGSISSFSNSDVTSAEDIQEITGYFLVYDMLRVNEEGVESARIADVTVERTQ